MNAPRLAAAALLLALVVPDSAGAKTPAGPHLRGEGLCVRARSAARCQPAPSGAPLVPLSTVTFSRPGTIQLGSGASLSVDADSVVELLPDASATPVAAKVVRLSRGRVEAATREAQVLVAGPGQLMAVVKRGASAVVAATADSFGVAALGGDVALSTGSSLLAVAPGSRRAVARGDSRADSKAQVAAPQITMESSVAFATAGAVALPVAWQPVAGASAYELRMRGPRGLFEAKTTEPSWAFASLGPGSYQIELRAVGADGLPGAWAPPHGVRVVGLSLPPGARLVGDQVEMPAQAHLGLSFLDGLEARYPGSSHAVAPPANLRLVGGNAQTLFLRMPGDTRDATLQVAPRAVRASVRLWPANPRWPQDPVHIAVQIADDQGRDALDEAKASVKVQLGITPLDVVWTREDGALTAVIAPRDLASPEALRVEVKDGRGQVIGNGHSEISAGRW